MSRTTPPPAIRILDTALDLALVLCILLVSSGIILGVVAVSPSPLVASVVPCAAVVLTVWVLHRSPERRSRLLLHGPRRTDLGQLGVAGVATLAFAPVLALGNHRLGASQPGPHGALPVDPAAEPLLVFVLGVLVGPFLEELTLRGWLLDRLHGRHGAAASLSVTALLFSAMHGSLPRVPYFFVLGLLLGGAVLLTRSVWSGVLLHALFNVSLLLLSLRFRTREEMQTWVSLHLGEHAVEVAALACIGTYALLAVRHRSRSPSPPIPG